MRIPVFVCFLVAVARAFHVGVHVFQPPSVHQGTHLCGCTFRSRLFRGKTLNAYRIPRRGGPVEQNALEGESVDEQTSFDEIEKFFEQRIAEAAKQMVAELDMGPGSVAVADNVLGPMHCNAMRQEAIAVTERGLLRGSASAYSTAPPQTFEEKYGDEPGISATVLPSGTIAGELSPRCGAYITAASRALSRALSRARRGALVHTEDAGLPTDHQLRLTTVAQQVHMDNAFDGVNKRLLTTIYYLNPDWQPEHGGRFIPWPCADEDAAKRARGAELPSTVLSFDDLPAEAKAQIPPNARDSIRLRISRKLAPSAAYEATMAQSRRRQPPVEPVGDRLVAFYSDELLHSVEPVASPPIVASASKKKLRVADDARFAITLWLPAPAVAAILPGNPSHEWLSQLRESGGDDADPIGGTLQIEEADEREVARSRREAKEANSRGFGGGGGKKGGGKARKKGRK